MKLLSRENIYTFLLSVFLVTLPITFNLNSILLIGIVVFFVLDKQENLKNKIKNQLKNKLVLAMILYFLVQCIGMIYTENIDEGLKRITTCIPFLVLPIVLVSEPISKNKIKLVVMIFQIAVIFALCYYALLQKFEFGRSLHSMSSFAFYKVGISQTYLGAMIYLATIISISEAYKNRNRAFNLLLIPFFLYFLFISSSRVALLVLFIALMFFVFVELKEKAKYIKSFIVVLVLVSVVSGIYLSPRLNQKSSAFFRTFDFDMEVIITKNRITETKNTVEHRMLISYLAFSIIKENPIFGVGTGDYKQELLKKYKLINFKAGVKSVFNTHNQYIEEYLKVGFLGGITILGLIFIFYKLSLDHKSYMMFYVTLYISIVCLTESFFVRHHGVAFSVFFIAFFYKYEKIFSV
ncbi:hypothetical protein AWE51_22315 [Aquimarina aggregata]|uniref:O-antigen ligase-related domain-containing protein n=2 Tax=Aquimarina aggregata TaxID=1642818 RepID=A0A163BIK7_9FLAO|nr:hypothetical protein AWE51_22315 [Aquimarina aggregata]